MQAPTDTTVARIKCSHTRHDPLDVDLALDIKAEDVADSSRRGALDVVEGIAMAVIGLAFVSGVVSVFALLLGCCHG